MRVPLPGAFLKAPLAHRGYHDAAAHRPENSLSAFRAAVDAGYGIELDVQKSADHQAMVFHDDDLVRMVGRPELVVSLSAAELGRLRLRDSDDYIPTLEELLAMVAGRVPVLIELKERLDSMTPTDGRLEKAVARVLDGYQGPVAVMSFNPHIVAELARVAPKVARGLTTEAYDPAENPFLSPEVCAHLREIPDYDRTHSSFISHQAADLGRPRVSELKAQGADILCWTIRSPEAEAKARQIAVNVTFEGYAAAIPA
ncbi:MAG: glycerophosphodiester phosphodiesterase family protein [Paracoccaceae bacterium]